MCDPISVASLLCEAMAEQGKDVKTQVNHGDKFGQTPLHRAALRGSTICALNLIQVGKETPFVVSLFYNGTLRSKIHPLWSLNFMPNLLHCVYSISSINLLRSNLQILLSSCYTFPCTLIRRIWGYINKRFPG